MNNSSDSGLLVETERPASQSSKENSKIGGLSSSIFAARRAELMRRLGNGAAIFRSAPAAVRSNDSDYRFRQDSDFHYLTGFDEPDSVCLLVPEHPEHKFVLFVRPR